MVLLENILHYFMVTCQPAVAGMKPQRKAALEANVSFVAADAFITCVSDQTIKVALLEATKKFDEEAKAHAAGQVPPIDCPAARDKWIDFTAVAVNAEAQQVGNSPSAPKLLPKLITYDEHGAPRNAQDAIVSEDGGGDNGTKLPWREWHLSAVAQANDEVASEIAAITVALRTLHANPRLRQMPVDVLFNKASNTKSVVATSRIEPNALELPPCVRSGKIYSSSVHPYRVPVVVKRVAAAHRIHTKKSVGDCGGDNEQMVTYYVHPDFKLPGGFDAESLADTGDTAAAWKWTGDESMHPFWAVQRLTQQELQRKAADGPRSRSLAFNAELVQQEFNVVAVGKYNNESATITIQVLVPIMTNRIAIEQGHQLIMEHVPAVTGKKRTEKTWKDKAAAKPAAKAKTKPSAAILEV